MTDNAHRGVRSCRRFVWTGEGQAQSTDWVAEECPVAFEYNGISHVVMMATPRDLEDFALGFSLTEGILSAPEQLLDAEISGREQGIVVSLTIVAERFMALKHKRRNLTGQTGCGLCGAESLDQAVSPPRVVVSQQVFTHAAIQRALSDFHRWQALRQCTGAVHGAAWCDPDGTILLVREDVGRHNALDKLLGALRRQRDIREGFVVVTSRASYEMVTKTANLGVPLLAAVSAPTSFAIDMAEACGLTLVGFVQPGRHAVYTYQQRLKD